LVLIEAIIEINIDKTIKKKAAMKESGRFVIERFKQDLKNDLIAGLLVVILATTIWLTITIANW